MDKEDEGRKQGDKADLFIISIVQIPCCYLYKNIKKDTVCEVKEEVYDMIAGGVQATDMLFPSSKTKGA